MQHCSIQFTIPKRIIFEKAYQLLKSVMFSPLMAFQVLFQLWKSVVFRVKMLIIAKIVAKVSENKVGEGFDLIFPLFFGLITKNLWPFGREIKALMLYLLNIFLLLTYFSFSIFTIKVHLIESELIFLARTISINNLPYFLTTIRNGRLRTIDPAQHARDEIKLYRELWVALIS